MKDRSEFMDDEVWGAYGNKQPCEHLLGLRNYLIDNNMTIDNDFNEPHGWCDVSCNKCNKTYEVILKPREGYECDYEEDEW